MKKILSLLFTIILLISLHFTASAWSVPWDISSDDNAQLFFGEVVSYYPKRNAATVAANKIIKGDIRKGGLVLVENIRDFIIPGNTYIFLTGISAETYIFYPDSYDTDTLTLSARTDNDNDIEKRINDGTYKKADDMRIDELNLIRRTNAKTSTLAQILNITKDSTEKIIIDFAYQIPFDEFFTLCSDITVYPMQKETFSSLHVMRTDVGDSFFTLTSDSKLIINSYSSNAEYSISSKDRDRLMSLIPENTENLPNIYNGTIFICIAAVFVFIFSVFLTAVSVILKRKKRV